ncbi:hypothetical protein AAG906_005531 [Vitis piasezkii]
MNSSCLYAGPLNKALLVNHCCERMESSVLHNSKSVAFIQSNVSRAVDAYAFEVSIPNVLGPHQCLRNRLRWMSYF